MSLTYFVAILNGSIIKPNFDTLKENKGGQLLETMSLILCEKLIQKLIRLITLPFNLFASYII